MDHPDKKVSKEISKLKDLIDQMDLTNIYSIFYPKDTEYTLESHGTVSKIDMLGHKVSLNKYKKAKKNLLIFYQTTIE
jgi:hypothetical protein